MIFRVPRPNNLDQIHLRGRKSDLFISKLPEDFQLLLESDWPGYISENGVLDW